MATGVDDQPNPGGDRGRDKRPDGLTPAQAHALMRSTPLTPAQFKKQRHLAARRTVPLRVMLNRPAEASAPKRP